MKIKHWAGYGCVNAKKVYESPRSIAVKVWGNHECGIVREYDNYMIENWLKRFLKDKRIDHYIIDDWHYERINDVDTEVATYFITLKEA